MGRFLQERCLSRMNHKELTRKSKFLSLVLRHRPDKIGIRIDENGWVGVRDLLNKAGLDLPTLNTLVKENNKKRFEFNADKTRIRARQGHSVSVDLGYEPVAPPDYLYHGTVQKYISNIRDKGLLKMNRHHVHLSFDVKTANIVGVRRGKPIILKIKAKQLQATGVKFYRTENDVWLAEHIPSEFIEFPE